MTSLAYKWPKPEVALDLLARDVKPDQWLRELVENGLGAGASRITIDAYLDNDIGHFLVRVADDGHGMKPDDLEGRLRNLGDPKHNMNFGIGGRVSTLAYNPAGVVWVSRVEGQPTSMVVGRRDGLQLFEQSDGRHAAVVEPDKSMLPAWIRGHGTAVILKGYGHSSTWDAIPFHYAKQLVRRYWTFGNAKVQVQGWKGKGGGLDAIVPFGALLERRRNDFGTVELSDGAQVHWYIIEPDQTLPKRSLLVGGLAVRHGNELYDWAPPRRFAQFGIYSKTAQARVVLIIEPKEDAVHPNASRARLLCSDTNSDLPWDSWAEDFIRQLPNQLKDLLPKALKVIDFSELEKAFGKEWRQRIAPTTHGVATTARDAESAEATGDRFDAELDPIQKSKPESDDDTPEDDASEKDEPPADETVRKQPKPRREVVGGNGDMHGRFARRADIPQVIPLGPEEWRKEIMPYDFEYAARAQRPDGNIGPVLFLKTTGYAITRQIELWIQQRPDIDSGAVADIVQKSYAFEVVSKIIHVLDSFIQREGWIDSVDEILSPRNLTFSVLGFLTIDYFIEEGIREHQNGTRDSKASMSSSPLFDRLM